MNLIFFNFKKKNEEDLNLLTQLESKIYSSYIVSKYNIA